MFPIKTIGFTRIDPEPGISWATALIIATISFLPLGLPGVTSCEGNYRVPAGRLSTVKASATATNIVVSILSRPGGRV